MMRVESLYESSATLSNSAIASFINPMARIKGLGSRV